MPATEACVRSHQGWFLRVSKEPDDNVAQVGDVCELLAKELHAGHEVLVGGIVGTILVNGVDPIFFEDLVPNRCCGNSKAQREKAEVRRPILSEVRRQLRGSTLTVLIPGVKQELLHCFTRTWNNEETYLFLLVLNLNVEGDPDLLRNFRDCSRIQGHLVASYRDIVGEVSKGSIGDCAMKISHVSCRARENKTKRSISDGKIAEDGDGRCFDG